MRIKKALKAVPAVLGRKRRRYPIRRDERGKSARRRSFDLFDRGGTSAEVVEEIGISSRTAYHYHSEWRTLPKTLVTKYWLVRKSYQRSQGFSDEMVKKFSKYFGWSEEEVIVRLEKPWGIKQLVMGKWEQARKREVQNQMEVRLDTALRLVGVMEMYGVKLAEIPELFATLVVECLKQTSRETGL